MLSILTVCRTDVEQEVNGLYTFDRKPKLDVTKMKGIIDQCRGLYNDTVSRLE
jgi:hypothetical protein